jgi:hypothetical protein
VLQHLPLEGPTRQGQGCPATYGLPTAGTDVADISDCVRLHRDQGMGCRFIPSALRNMPYQKEVLPPPKADALYREYADYFPERYVNGGSGYENAKKRTIGRTKTKRPVPQAVLDARRP